MATLKIPTPLRSYTDGQTEVSVDGANIAQAMDDLIGKFPTLKPQLYDGDGKLASVRESLRRRKQYQGFAGTRDPAG